MSVANTSTGHVWTWKLSDGTTEALTTDDDGGIELIDILGATSKSTEVAVPGVGLLPLNAISHLDFGLMFPGVRPDFAADEHLYLAKWPGLIMGFAIPPTYGTLLGFFGGQGGVADGPLMEVLTGTREALFATGLIPLSSQNASDKPSAFLPVRISHDKYMPAKLVAWPPYSGPIYGSHTYARIEVGADGVPIHATWFMGPASSETYVQRTAMLERFAPARLNGTAVASIYFQEMTF